MRIKIINVVKVDVFLHSFFPAFHYPLFHILSNTKQAFAWCYICWKAPSCCYATIKYIWGELLSSLLLPFSNLCTQCCRNCTFADVVSFALFPLCKQGSLVNTLYTVESEICDKTYLSDHICSRQHIDLSSGATDSPSRPSREKYPVSSSKTKLIQLYFICSTPAITPFTVLLQSACPV